MLFKFILVHCKITRPTQFDSSLVWSSIVQYFKNCSQNYCRRLVGIFDRLLRRRVGSRSSSVTGSWLGVSVSDADWRAIVGVAVVQRRSLLRSPLAPHIIRRFSEPIDIDSRAPSVDVPPSRSLISSSLMSLLDASDGCVVTDAVAVLVAALSCSGGSIVPSRRR